MLEEQLQKAEDVRHAAINHGLAVVINMLRLWTTICRCASGAPWQKRLEYESGARHTLGKAFFLVYRCQMTPHQDALFQKVFRELTACIPIRPPAKVIRIDAWERIA